MLKVSQSDFDKVVMMAFREELSKLSSGIKEALAKISMGPAEAVDAAGNLKRSKLLDAAAASRGIDPKRMGALQQYVSRRASGNTAGARDLAHGIVGAIKAVPKPLTIH